MTLTALKASSAGICAAQVRSWFHAPSSWLWLCATYRSEPEPALKGVVVDAATARKRARDELYRSTPEAIMLRAISSR